MTDEFSPPVPDNWDPWVYVGGGGIRVVRVPELDNAPPGTTLQDQHGQIIYKVPGDPQMPAPPTPVEAGGDQDYEFQGENPLVPTPPGQPGPPSQPVYAGPPEIFQSGPPPLDEGGPEERAPAVEFDDPLIAPGPADAGNQAPIPGPIEGELLPRDGPAPRVFDDEGFPDWGFDREGPYRRRQIEGERVAERVVWKIVSRSIGGPWSEIAKDVLIPEILGSGELPFPPIPQVSIPAPEIRLPTPDFGLPSFPAPELQRPAVPDVVIVTAPAPTPAPIPAPSTPNASPLKNPLPNWTEIIANIARSRLRRRGSPILRNLFGSQPTPAPIDQNIPLDAGDLPGNQLQFGDLGDSAPYTDPLTSINTGELPLPEPDPGPNVPRTPPTITTTTEEDRCKCKEPKKRKREPSNVIAHLKPFDRRMSKRSLKNLKRGPLRKLL